MLRLLSMASMILSLCAVASAQAQDYPRVEFFNSYSNAVDSGGDSHGWLTSLTYNRDAHFGVVGEFSRHYRTAALQTPDGLIKDRKGFKVALVGIQFYTFRHRPVAPYFRLLMGGSEENVIANDNGKPGFRSRSIFRVAIGGGLDVKISNRFALRAAQLDVMKINDNTLNRLRFSTGLVLRF